MLILLVWELLGYFLKIWSCGYCRRVCVQVVCTFVTNFAHSIKQNVAWHFFLLFSSDVKLAIVVLKNKKKSCKLVLMYNLFISEGSIAGGTAGVVVETALYPIDTIKTRLQVNLISHCTIAVLITRCIAIIREVMCIGYKIPI